MEKDDQGWDQWVIDGKPWGYRHGVFGDMGAIGRDLEPHFTPGVVSYEEGIAFAPGGWDPKERLAVLDKEGIDKVVLYPSLGHHLGGWLHRPRAGGRVLPGLQQLAAGLVQRISGPANPHRSRLLA